VIDQIYAVFHKQKNNYTLNLLAVATFFEMCMNDVDHYNRYVMYKIKIARIHFTLHKMMSNTFEYTNSILLNNTVKIMDNLKGEL